MVAYVYAADRKPVLSFAEAAQRAEVHLGDFADVLQVDGYGGYLRPRGADGRSGSSFVGRTYVVSFTNWPTHRRSQPMCCAASPCFLPSRAKCADHRLNA